MGKEGYINRFTFSLLKGLLRRNSGWTAGVHPMTLTETNSVNRGKAAATVRAEGEGGYR